MDKGYYLACDFSGIQRYVLGVKTAGQAQAKRLRARSFLLELYERAALLSVQKRLGFADDDVLIQGGGGFLVRLPQGTGPEAVGDLAAELQSMMWQELRGEVQIAMARGKRRWQPGRFWRGKNVAPRSQFYKPRGRGTLKE